MDFKSHLLKKAWAKFKKRRVNVKIILCSNYKYKAQLFRCGFLNRSVTLKNKPYQVLSRHWSVVSHFLSNRKFKFNKSGVGHRTTPRPNSMFKQYQHSTSPFFLIWTILVHNDLEDQGQSTPFSIGLRRVP